MAAEHDTQTSRFIRNKSRERGGGGVSFCHSLLGSWEINNGKKLTVLDSKDSSPLKTVSYVSHSPWLSCKLGRHVLYFTWEVGSGLQNISGLSWALQGGSSFMGNVALWFWVPVLCGKVWRCLSQVWFRKLSCRWKACKVTLFPQMMWLSHGSLLKMVNKFPKWAGDFIRMAEYIALGNQFSSYFL